MKTAFATGDGESFTNRHFGDNDYYYIYDISESESRFIKRINNTAATIKEKMHADPEKAMGITGLLKRENVQVVVSKVYGPNIKRIRKNFVCVIMNNPISDSINIIKENFKDISDEWEKGEERKHINFKKVKSQKLKVKMGRGDEEDKRIMNID
ncbi:MAG: dinitrogenase iron-molybdenum cofactor biosynthesis protein [Bacteroidetes bacterium]|nr:dinitrogenase iron-molybdenum cofactor biosynthesis protein [Bacteroidota bacterium]